MPGATLTPESNGNNLSDHQASEDSTRPSDPTSSAHAKLKENEVAWPIENGKKSTHSDVILIFL